MAQMDADELLEKAERDEARADQLKAEAERVHNVDSLADTPWSKLFHVSRTSRREQNGGHSTVEVQYRVTVDGIETHSEPVKTRGGEHLRGTDAWDGTIKLRVEPFKKAIHAGKRIEEQLKREERNLRKNAGTARKQAERMQTDHPIHG